MPFLFALLLFDAGATTSVCDAFKDKFASYLDHDSAQYLDEAQSREALTFLEKFPAPTPAEIEDVRAGLSANFADNFVTWLKNPYLRCDGPRLSVSRALMRTAQSTPALKTLIKPRLTALMKRPRQPTLLTVMVDLVLIDFGLTEKFWNADPALLAEVKAQRLKNKAYSTEFSKKYPALDQDIGIDPPDDVAAARLRASPNLPTIKNAILDELDHARTFAAQNAKFVARLK